jgi:hypothetical protein
VVGSLSISGFKSPITRPSISLNGVPCPGELFEHAQAGAMLCLPGPRADTNERPKEYDGTTVVVRTEEFIEHAGNR